MEESIMTRMKHAWNAFMNRDPTYEYNNDIGSGNYIRPDRKILTRGNERSIITSVYNRIAMDAASMKLLHVRLDDEHRYIETIDSGLNNCLTLEANIDQTGRSFIQDVVLSMLDEGCIAIVPVETSINPKTTNSYDILSLRTGKIVEWYPRHVKVNVYNDEKGMREDILMPKKLVSIIENPLYAVINEPNSTMQRLIRKLNILDAIDNQSGSGKLDLIIQLPYVIRTDARRKEANDRREEIERQLSGSKYGIAYTDGTERITQLNRPVENNLMKQIEYLTTMLYSQLGLTQSILDGSADEKEMLNYYNRTIEPILSAIACEMKRKFLTKTARTQLQSIEFFRDPFKLVPINELVNVADTFTRNEILSSNDIRQIIGMKPSDDPAADELRNKNINQSKEDAQKSDDISFDENALTDDIDSQLDQLQYELDHSEIKHYASEYYDPVKAHEYYMRTRELKGRKSTSGLNANGKEAAGYVKQKLNEERNSKIEEHKNYTNSSIDENRSSSKKELENLRDSKKAEISRQAERLKNEISSLRNRLRTMDTKEKRKYKEMIESQINSLRDGNNKLREQISNEYSEKSKSVRTNTSESNSKLREDHKTFATETKKEYEEKYNTELDKIRSDSSMINQKGGKNQNEVI